MRNEGSKDTIAAIATPPGEGGIAIVRISGARAGEILRAAFRPAHKGEMKHGQMRYGTLTDQAGAPIDEVMAVLFRAPRSYTREDVAEIHLHGGTMCARAAMERLLSLGARAAEPGEFTYRAFMNGRVDLSEAEAIMGLIGARSQAARRASVRQLRGGVSAPIGRMREELTGLLAKIEAATDFPDEIDEDVTARDVLEGAARIREELARAADGHRARIVREGASVVLCGRPNVGKSSLMNALLSADRAIVTDIPGTTRDVLTERFEIGGVRYQLSDTAGIRETVDAIEKIGVDRARDALRDADCVLLVLDASTPLSPADQAMLAARDERYVTILNKCDLLPAQEIALPSPAVSAVKDTGTADTSIPHTTIYTSARTGVGVDEILRAIERVCRQTGASEEQMILPRHIECAHNAMQALDRAIQAIQTNQPLDLSATDLREALAHLGDITGETMNEHVIDRVFSDFCVGK